MSIVRNQKAKPESALARGQKSLCAVSIGIHITLVMPLEKGLQLVRILDDAMMVDGGWYGLGPGIRYGLVKQLGETKLIRINEDQITAATKPNGEVMP